MIDLSRIRLEGRLRDGIVSCSIGYIVGQNMLASNPKLVGGATTDQ